MIERREPDRARDEDDERDERRGRQQPARAAGPELREGDGPRGGELVEEEAGDEEAGEDEEDVDAEEAGAGPLPAGVVEDNQGDGDRSQPLDIGTEAQVALRRLAARRFRKCQGTLRP